MNRETAICRLVRAVYMQSDQLNLLIETFAKQAVLMNEKVKSGEDLLAAKELVQSDGFIKKMNLSLEPLTVDEINALADFYESDAMKKFRMSANEIASLHSTLKNAFLEKPS